MGDTHLLKLVVEKGNQLLGNSEGKDELGSNHKNLGQETLEEGTEALVTEHVPDDVHTTLRVVKVTVLDTSLDNVERGSNGDRCDGTTDGGTEVLEEGGLAVVLQSENPLLDECASSEKRERSRGVTTSSPESTSILYKRLDMKSKYVYA